MARYKETDKKQGLFISVNLKDQIVPGTFEYTLQELLDKKIDLSIFDRKYNNDETGAGAIEPRILLKIIIYCYSLGVITSRKIGKMCHDNMAVKALAEDIEPHYTTISNFVSGMSGEIEKLFTEVLMVCSEMGLIKGKMFAVDGCRLSSNAAKEWSGTKKELTKKYNKIKALCGRIVEEHKSKDRISAKEQETEEKKLERLEAAADRIRNFILTHEERTGAGGEAVKSNITDNESGKIKGPHGYIQGYNGLAVADSKNQVIVACDANGSVSEGQYFERMIEKTERSMRAVKGEENPLEGATFLGDTAYFSEDNLQRAKEKGIEAIIPDPQYRQRDEQIKEGERRKGKERFDVRHFKYHGEEDYYICPNGKELIFKSKVQLNRNRGKKYEAKKSDCKECPYKDKCLRSRSKKKNFRTLYIPISEYETNLSQEMREKIDKKKYKKIYSHRMQIIEPVFANITYCKGMERFTVRTKAKVDIQWKLYCIVHNIGKCQMAKRKKDAA
jgi:transposase